jgi:putative membrane protein
MDTQDALSKATEPLKKINDFEYRIAVLSKMTLSMLASQLALAKGDNKYTKEFAGFELIEAIAVTEVMQEICIQKNEITVQDQGFLSELEKLHGRNFDKMYMKLELENHLLLKNLTELFLSGSSAGKFAPDAETRRLAKMILLTLNEHIDSSGKIYSELMR